MVVTLERGRHVELYRSDLARIRPEVTRVIETRGQPAADLEAAIEAILGANELPRKLSDDSVETERRYPRTTSERRSDHGPHARSPHELWEYIASRSA